MLKSNKKRGSVSHVAKASAFVLRLAIVKKKEEEIERIPSNWKRIEVKLPCTLAELVYEISVASFSLCEELAFKAGIQFLPAKEIVTDGQATEKIPF